MKRICFWLAAALLAVACAKENPSTISEPTSVHTLRAGFAEEDPDTRSRLEFAETAAKVLWTAGDDFRMYKMSDTGYSQTVYTTQDDGVESATFTTTKRLGEDDSYTSIYPAGAEKYSVYRKNNDVMLRIPVPSEQTAVPGGLAEGLNMAAAWSSGPDDDLQFRNLLSIIRFRVKGKAVSSLASVVFDAGKTVAGDAALYFADGELHFGFTSNFSNTTYPRSTSVTLTGTFTEGQDYCMAMVPASLPSGFDMYFCDADGNVLAKHSSKAVYLSRSRILDFGTIDLGDTWEVEPAPEIVEYMHQKVGRKKNVIAILADGYCKWELDRFEALAKSAVDYLFSVEPYKTYKDYFTVYIFRAESNESGAGVIDTDGNIITPVDNRFGSRWPTDSYSAMTANPSIIQDYLRTHCPEVVSGELTWRDVPTALIINDSRYGGICHVYSSGWNYAQIPHQYAGGAISWAFPQYQAVNVRDDSEGYRQTTEAERDEMGRHVGDWRNTFLHEFGGHGYGRLADEYWKTTTKYTEPGKISGHSYPVPYALNVSGFYDDVPWQETLLDNLGDWMDRNPDYSRIGILHGGHASLYYRWRSEMTSCMIDNRPYFNTWSRMLIVSRIMEKTGEPFSLEDFIAKDVTFDPVRPAEDLCADARRRMAAQAALAPEMPMLPPPELVEDAL